MSNPPYPGIIEDISQQLNTNYMGIASFTMLVWDHVDTFADEVEFIWMGKKGLIGYLFLINRYITPLGFMVNLYAYFSPVWDTEYANFLPLDVSILNRVEMKRRPGKAYDDSFRHRCDRFVRFEGSMTIIGINIVAIMMFLRIYALYNRNYWVLGVVLILLAVEFSVNAWLMTRAQRVHHNPDSGVVACTMIFDPAISKIASASAWLPLLYDTTVLGLTLYRTLPSLKNRNTSYIMKRLFQDGLVYYTAIFAVTLVLTLMIIFAPEGLKNITAQLELLLTVAMMSRITINLKKSVQKLNDTRIKAEMPSMFTQHTQFQVDPSVKIVAPGFNQNQTQTDTIVSTRVNGVPTVSFPLVNMDRKKQSTSVQELSVP